MAGRGSRSSCHCVIWSSCQCDLAAGSQESSFASTVSFSRPGLSSAETGQVSLVASAAWLNVAWSMPGTSPSVSRWIAVILKPSGPLLSVSVARVRIVVGVWPSLLRLLASAMLKQAASAAASSSSGLLPVTPSSNREMNDTLASRSAPLSAEAVPDPLRRSPDHVPLACRRMSGILGLLSRLAYGVQPVAVVERHDELRRREGEAATAGF